MKLSIIIPTYNEAESIAQLIQRIGKACTSNTLSYEIILIDDHSYDDTVSIAETFLTTHPLTIRLKQGTKGKSTSLLEGFQIAQGEVIAMIDADLQYEPEDIPRLYHHLQKNTYDIVVARRKYQAQFSWYRRVLGQIYATLFGKYWLDLPHDIQAGLKVFRRAYLPKPTFVSTAWGFDYVFLYNAKKNGARIGDYSIPFNTREYGFSDVQLSTYIELLSGIIWLRLKDYKAVIFGLIGILNTSIDFTITLLLITLFQPTTVPILLGINTVAFVVANINSYLLNKRHTFQDTSSHRVTKILSFFSISLISLMLNNLVFLGIIQLLTPTQTTPSTLIVILAKLGATIFSLLVNYWGYKRIVFSSQKGINLTYLNYILIFILSAGILFHTTLDISSILPRNITWLLQGGDWSQHFLGWHFYRNTPWNFPLGNFSGLLYPSQTNIGYTDSIPLLGLPLKLISSILGTPFQYIGAWIYLCITLQGIIGFWVAKKLKLSNGQALITGLLLQTSPMLIARLGHPALCAHWMILWSLGLYLDKEHSKKIFWLSILIIVLSGLTHPYIAIMSWSILLARFLRISTKLQYQIFSGLILTGTLLTVWYMVGYLGNQANIIEGGLGRYSAHFSTWIHPIYNFDQSSSLIMPNWTKTYSEQYEGYAYLGLGSIIASILLIPIYIRHIPSLLKKYIPAHWPLFLLLGALTLFAFIEESLFLRIQNSPLPGSSQLINLASIFRANGRFIWPTSYVITFIIVTSISRRFSRTIALILLFLIISINLIDTSPLLFQSYRPSEQVFSFQDPLMQDLPPILQDRHKHIIFYPAQHPYRSYFRGDDYAPLAYLAGTHQRTINLGYIARYDKDQIETYNAIIQKELKNGITRDHHLYLIPDAEQQKVSHWLQQSDSPKELIQLNRQLWYIP